MWNEADIPLLLTGAEFLAFPSVYEGFGTPPVEALACGTPVLTANVASMPEVLKDQAVYADPYSVDSIAEKNSLICMSRTHCGNHKADRTGVC